MDNKKVIRMLMECVNIASKQYPAMAEQYLEAFQVAEDALKYKKDSVIGFKEDPIMKQHHSAWAAIEKNL